MRHFAFFFLLLAGFSLSAQQSDQNRRHYRPSRSFLENADENCFEATRREADRAFAQRCWEDASLLYRAAKNCVDADQKRRQEMTDRLEACREAAELELVNRERHAIAANRADDSHELLRMADRSLAFRMADFANKYIAPPDETNPDCQQAMFDAWYASPGALGGEFDDSIQAPFCYQLGENLGDNIIVRFGGKGDQKKIYAFSVTRHLLYSWDAQTLEATEPVEVDPSVTGFEIAPDGNTFLFYSNTLLIFWRKGRELYRLNVPRIHDFCFDGKSEEFFLLDTVERKIEALSLREVYLNATNKIQKQRKMEELRIPPTFRPWMTGINPELLDFAVWGGDTWLGYRDSVYILNKPQSGKGWQIVRRYSIPTRIEEVGSGLSTHLNLYPEQNLAFYSNDTSSTSIYLPTENGTPVSLVHFAGLPLAGPSRNGYTANLKSESYVHAGMIRIYNKSGGISYIGALQELEYYPMLAGRMDPDGEWLVIPSPNNGVLNCWRLENRRQNIFHKFQFGEQSVTDITPDGRFFISHKPGSLQVCDCVRPGETLGKPMQVDFEPEFGFIDNKMSNHWVASLWSSDSTLVWNWETGKRRLFPFRFSADWPVAFTEDERYIAATHDDGQIRVYDLSSGQVISTRSFTGQIQEMAFVPGTNELVLLQMTTSDYDYEQKKVVRIIHPFRSDYRQRTVRLHEYLINLMAVSANGDYLALSDGRDVRIFALDNLTDEIAQIVPSGEGLTSGETAVVLAIQFTPDGRSLVASYTDQRIVFWNIETGQTNFKLRLPTEASYMSFTKIRMIPEDNLLCLLAPGDGLLIRSFDPEAIGAAIQPPNYHLIAFSANQISKYNLDQALNYPGNFERLAGSGDIPLIKSFLNYYFQQAHTSGNIDRVSEYCNRAFVLYSQLDITTQAESQPSIVDMYENYLWKWLIRDRPDKADQVLQYVNRQFGRPTSSLLSEANIALVKGSDADLRRAVRLYAEWITASNDQGQAVYFDVSLKAIFDKFIQLAEFELIGDKQIDCLCGMFGAWPNFSLCNNRTKNSALVPFDADMRLRWDIYKKMYLTTLTERHVEKFRLLQSAQDDARQLVRIKPAMGRPELEKVTREIGKRYFYWGLFEQGNDRAPELLRRGISEMENYGAARQQERQWLETLAFLHYALAIDQYDKDQFEAALETSKKNYDILKRLWAVTTDTSDFRRYSDELLGNQWTLLGNISLMTGDLTTARAAYDEANNIFTQGLNSYFTAHVDLAEGEEYAALINYGGIFTAEQLGNAVFDLERLAARLPARKDSILAFIPRMRTAWLANHLRSSSLEVDYRYATLQRQHAISLDNYNQALEWNTKVLEHTKQLIESKNTSATWAEFRADAQLNQTYFLIVKAREDTSMLTRAIDFALGVEQEIKSDKEGGIRYPSHEALKTNTGHAFLLRNRPGDREQAIRSYQEFLALDASRNGADWDVLEKDFRDFYDLGFKWPDLPSVIAQIKPAYITISAEEWREMGVQVEK